MKFFCIADEDTVHGLRLAGVEGQSVTSPEETAAALTGAVSAADIGIVIITRPIAAGIRPLIEAMRLGHDRTLIVEIPGPRETPREHSDLQRLVQAAVGVRVGME